MFSSRLSLSAAAQICHRLGIGLHAGVDLLTLLQSEASQGPTQQRVAMQLLVDGARSGEQLSAVMTENPKYFPTLMTSLTRVGEETGRLERTLQALAKHYEHMVQTRREFVRSIAWPGLQLFGAIMVVSLLIYMMGMLTPAGGGQMADILGFGLRGGSGVLWFWFYIALFFAIVGGAVWAFTKNVAGVQNLIPLIYMIPKVGPAIQTITIARFCWTMALSLDAGLDPIRSIRLSLDSTASDYYRAGADDAEAAIRGGATLAGGLQATNVFPSDFIVRVETAELSGTDAESMMHLAEQYEERARTAVKFLAGTATVLVRAGVILFVVYLIIRISSTYLNALNSAFEPI